MPYIVQGTLSYFQLSQQMVRLELRDGKFAVQPMFITFVVRHCSKQFMWGSCCYSHLTGQEIQAYDLLQVKQLISGGTRSSTQAVWDQRLHTLAAQNKVRAPTASALSGAHSKCGMSCSIPGLHSNKIPGFSYTQLKSSALNHTASQAGRQRWKE